MNADARRSLELGGLAAWRERLPADLVPRSTSVLRVRLRRSWENLGKAIPPGFARWPRARLVAVWIRLWDASTAETQRT